MAGMAVSIPNPGLPSMTCRGPGAKADRPRRPDCVSGLSPAGPCLSSGSGLTLAPGRGLCERSMPAVGAEVFVGHARREAEGFAGRSGRQCTAPGIAFNAWPQMAP
jgi:hypothetical protein